MTRLCRAWMRDIAISVSPLSTGSASYRAAARCPMSRVIDSTTIPRPPRQSLHPDTRTKKSGRAPLYAAERGQTAVCRPLTRGYREKTVHVFHGSHAGPWDSRWLAALPVLRPSGTGHRGFTAALSHRYLIRNCCRHARSPVTRCRQALSHAGRTGACFG